MISFIQWFLNQNEIIKIFRMPSKTVFRIHLLGLTLALFFVVFTIVSGVNFPGGISYQFEDCARIFECFEINIGEEINASGMQILVLLLIYLLGTYIGGPFVIFVIILYLVSLIFSIEINWINNFLFLNKWYLIGYSFGAILGILYNDLLFLYLWVFKNKSIKISYVYRNKKEFNVIKSPVPNEEYVPENGWDEKKLYNFSLTSIPKNPYTIVFIANPFFCKQLNQADRELPEDQFKLAIEAHRNNPDNFFPDPIIKDKNLFYKMVDRALLAFQSDEVLGNPDIWSRVRVITIFPKSLSNRSEAHKYGLVEAVQDRYFIDNRLTENLSIPLIHEVGATLDNAMVHPYENYKKLISVYQDEFENLQEYKNVQDFSAEMIKIDVIFALSASFDFDRSLARFSTISYTDENRAYPELPGKDYTIKTEFSENLSSEPVEKTLRHENYSPFPGIIALNVIGLRQKVFMHEFAHAMSSNNNGAIVDEYFDQLQINSNEQPTPSPFSINRQERKPNALNPIPAFFAQYNNVMYYSDLDHPSAEENWVGYFPQRTAPFIGCTMDRTIGHYEFDPLIKRFMYDRLITKLNR